MKGTRSFIRLSLILGMLLYAVPQLPIGKGFTLPTLFAVSWLVFALILVAAHLYDVIGVDEAVREEQRRVGRMRKWQMEERLRGTRRMLAAKK
ncbi:hypothetical protein [Gorillibacterium timonense]|uniref:hypothetical protein n=1 Tax=Gorillibacterium timonense TaxID=1689269 RepID=UPI00071D2718|nr:hypothetical protein [Gorillibacterium timonense]